MTETARYVSNSLADLGKTLNALLADIFIVYMKTKWFHWHMTGPHFRDNHLLLDEQAGQIFGMTDALAERVRKLGLPTIASIGSILQSGRIAEQRALPTTASAMLEQLRRDNVELAGQLRQAHRACGEYDDIATASLLESYIDQTERRIWFLTESA